jgi:YesN/AraC family two-component response regulator
MGMYKILMVEDDKALRFVYSKMKVWSNSGFVIAKEASNGKEALDILKTEVFDLIVSDIRMPFTDGIEMLGEIKKRGIDTAVVFISSYDDFEYARQGLVLGAFDYILKPVKENTIHEVLERLKTVLNKNSELPSHIANAVKAMNVDIDNNKLLRQVCEYMAKKDDLSVTMDDVAANLNINKDYMGKLFKAQSGITFNKFCSLLKVEYAKELLNTGNYKAYQISEMLGYSSVDYFTRIFKDITGKTPSDYKKNV